MSRYTEIYEKSLVKSYASIGGVLTSYEDVLRIVELYKDVNQNEANKSNKTQSILEKKIILMGLS